MRLTLQALGLELDIAFGLAGSDEAEPTTSATKGDVLATPVTAVRAEVPWEDAGSLHQFDPGNEDRRIGFVRR